MKDTTTRKTASLLIYVYASTTTIQGWDMDTLEDFPKVKCCCYEDFESECLWGYAEMHNIDLEKSEIEYVDMR